MNNESYKGKIMNLFELLKTQKIEIPIIQRDYAQGRKEAGEIRKKFLQAIFESITENNKPLRLDFIYGSNAGDAFLPLDGQQRLTTLFLLHWYAASIRHEYTKEIIDVLKKFTYETRITSRDFCNSLVSNKVEIEKNDKIISSKIIDSSWFFLSWKNDPTIDAMLRSLDDIHIIFSNVDNLWEKLTAENTPITFYYVELANMGLTDDLYIKMNARGKLLSQFENFKASMQKHINDNEWEIDIPHHETFLCKIDTEWTDFFWVNFKKNNAIDEAFMRFISTIGMIRICVEKIPSKSEERLFLISGLQENPDAIRPEMFTIEGFKYLYGCFKIYSELPDRNINIDLPFPLWRHKPQKNFLSEIVYDDNVYSTLQINSATYTQKVLFFAQTEYLRRNVDFDEQKYIDWMRVVRNIVSRGDIDKDGNRPDIIRSPQAFDGVITLINELADGCDNIYTHLSNNDLQIKSIFAKNQIEEEKLKANLICYNNGVYKDLLFEAEDNELTRGRLEFLFYCINFNFDCTNFDFEMFKKISNVFKTYFNNESETKELNRLRRALLTIEVDRNYEFYEYWWSFWNVIDGATKRRLIDKFRELEYYIYSEYKEYFKKLVLTLVNKNMDQIIADFTPPEDMPNWKIRLIKEPSLLDLNNKSNYIAIAANNDCCYLLKSKRPRDIEGCIKVE